MKASTRSAIIKLGCRAGLIALCAAPLPAAHAQKPAVPSGPGSLSGIWLNAEYKGTGQFSARDRALHTSDGTVPPLLPGPAAVLDKRIKDSDAGNVFANTLTQCLPGGVPEMEFGASYPVQILETPGQVTVLYEEQNHFRTIMLSGTHPKDPDPSYMGNSIGHWDGDTLVIDTIGLNDKTTLDMVGTPHTEALHVVERYRRLAADKLEISVMIDDPGTFSKPWNARITYKAARPGTPMEEYICENNRNGPDEHGFTSFGHAAGN